jgi:hypothetical protein
MLHPISFHIVFPSLYQLTIIASTPTIVHVQIRGNGQFHHEPRQATNSAAKGARRAVTVAFLLYPGLKEGW